MKRWAPGLAALLTVAFLFSACEPQPPAAEPVARAYAAAWVNGDYPAMWDLLTEDSKARVGEDGFLKRLPRIAEEMTLTSLEATTGAAVHPAAANGSPDPRRATVSMRVTFHTKRVGDFARDTFLTLVMVGEKDKAAWKIDWTPEAIVPHLLTGRLVRMTRLPTSRGRILARDGTELATFTDAAVVGVVPEQIKNESGMLASLASALGVTSDDIKAKYNASWVRPDSFVPIKTLTGAAFTALRPRLSVIEGVQLQAQRVRSYPTGLASQLIGYLGEATDADAARLAARGFAAGDLIGKTGLEQQLDDVLGGTYGWRLSIVGADERPIELLGETAPVAGQDAVLALDPALQAAAEKALGDQKGAIVAEDPWTGEVLVLASRPSFDLNLFVSGDSAAIAKLNADPRRPLVDRAVSGTYPTGSAFKPVTAAAALRNGLYHAGERIDCPAKWSGYGVVQLNHETGNLGLIDLRTALARSCNTFFYELGKRLNDTTPDLLPNEASSFGLGKATDIDYVLEAEGIVPSPAWKKRAFTNPQDQVWNPGDATNLAIGQGFLLATPLQMANFAAALANDGIVWKPRMVLEFRTREGAVTRTFDPTRLGQANTTPADLSLIRDGMRAVVSDPNGTVYYKFLGFPTAVAGKSGTAETPSGNPDAWFIGFAPYDGPKLAIATLYEEKPGLLGSQDAGAASRAVFAAKFGGTP
ncbi:MAG TPA: penicillin-binding transpeptidase domain-containing protein [Candidatus Limnocylindria bacterium]|nr:penicillin-binding transpeptidase domain-containing protein [Candidatus Limnocylindria bacterium]